MSITLMNRIAANQAAWLHQYPGTSSNTTVSTGLKRILTIAHRGASGSYPENTLAAFAAAIKMGAEMCELDVHLTRDSVPVVIHDDTIDRTTNSTGAVAMKTLRKLREADAGIRCGRRFAGEHIPTLAETLRLASGCCALNIELKGIATERPVCELIDSHDAIAATIVSSFDWTMLARVREIDSRIRIGLLAKRGASRLLGEAAALGAEAVHPRTDIVAGDFCERAHARGLKVFAWTCDDPAEMRRLSMAGVDGIMTNYPDRLVSLLAER
jgi:glycerophosphoryl diester phosphodiesterase